MVDVHRYHEISEADHRILNPLADADVLRIGEICGLDPGQRHLDLASGKGEMLCQYDAPLRHDGCRRRHIDACIAAANARAKELGVSSSVEFVHEDASTYAAAPDSFDVVSCIGAAWIGRGLAGTLDLVRVPVRSDGWLLVGDVFWNENPPTEVREALGYGDEIADLAGTLARFDDAGVDLVQMVLANQDTWDRYTASQWLNVSKWLEKNAAHPDAEDVRRTR